MRSRKQALLTQAEQQRRKEHYIRMLRVGLRNKEAEFDRRREDEENKRRLELQFQSFAAGIVRVH
jgi:hypothetical protein